MGRFEDALNDMVDLVVDDIKEQQNVAEVGQPNPINFQNPIQNLLVEILLEKSTLILNYACIIVWQLIDWYLWN